MQLQEIGVGALELLLQLLVLLKQVGGDLLVGALHLRGGSHSARHHLLDDLRIAILIRNLQLLHCDILGGVDPTSQRQIRLSCTGVDHDRSSRVEGQRPDTRDEGLLILLRLD